MWALKYDKAAKKVVSNDAILAPKIGSVDKKGKPSYVVRPAAFCEDANHEIIVLDWAGKAWRMASK